MRFVTWKTTPAAEAYWTLQLLTSIGWSVRLASSMKSFLKVAPELPPPPYTAETTTSVDKADARSAGTAVADAAATTVNRIAVAIRRRDREYVTRGLLRSRAWSRNVPRPSDHHVHSE